LTKADFGGKQSLSSNKKARYAGLFLVELAGLEPATSWVRFTRAASPSFATVRHLSLCGFAAAPTRHPSPRFVIAT
jgi:hypothetical protein